MIHNLRKTISNLFLKLSGRDVSDLLRLIETQQKVIETLQSDLDIQSSSCRAQILKGSDGNYSLDLVFYWPSKENLDVFMRDYASKTALEIKKMVAMLYKDLSETKNVIPIAPFQK